MKMLKLAILSQMPLESEQAKEQSKSCFLQECQIFRCIKQFPGVSEEWAEDQA